MDLPATALDYVHRAGRVERLGGKKGCTVVNVVRDLREEQPGVPTPAAPVLDPSQPLSFPLPRRKGTFGGVQVDRAEKLAAQLHLDMPAVTIHRGEFVPLVVQQPTPRIATPPTPKKPRSDAQQSATSTVITAAYMATMPSAGNAHMRAFSTLFGRRAPWSPSASHQSRRGISTRAGHGGFLLHNSTADPNGADVHVVFITPEGERVPVTGKEGENLLALAHANKVELEGACEGSVACSTCHVILPDEYYAKLETPEDEENDMLDLAFGLTETSRLGCQVRLSKDLEGMEITMPSATRNMAVDGHKAKPH
jgi:ferredoxin